jgi:hypothetical protein
MTNGTGSRYTIVSVITLLLNILPSVQGPDAAIVCGRHILMCNHHASRKPLKKAR